MSNIIDCKNEVFLQGKIVTEPKFSHESFGQEFYTFDVETPRLSGTYDVIPVIAHKYMCDTYQLTCGKNIAIGGQFRSFNKDFDGYKSKLVLSVFLKDVYEYDVKGNSNIIELAGYICKPPIYRKTPFGREIADFILAVNRKLGRADHVPCIAWGSNARLISKMVVSKYVSFEGRIQSRQYEKLNEQGESEIRTTYEVSANNIIKVV